MTPNERARAREKARRLADGVRGAVLRMRKPAIHGAFIETLESQCLRDLANAVDCLADVLEAMDGGAP